MEYMVIADLNDESGRLNIDQFYSRLNAIVESFVPLDQKVSIQSEISQSLPVGNALQTQLFLSSFFFFIVTVIRTRCVHKRFSRICSLQYKQDAIQK